MKILIVANYAKEHINKFHISTIKKLKEEGHTVDVACRADAEVPYCDHLYDIPCERNPFRFQSIQCIKMIKSLIKENKYDIVHCHTLCGRTIGTIASKGFIKDGLKLVVTCHGLNYYEGSPIITKAIMPLDFYLMSKANLIFSVNRADLAYMEKHHYRLKETRFCPPSINQSKFSNVDVCKLKRNDTRRELGARDSDIVLIYVAELNQNKNQTFLLQVVKLLKKHYSIKLILVGPDHYNGKVESTAKELGIEQGVLCLGWRNDVCELLCAADIYVASSIREGFGINLLEASVCELPIVATDNRGHREIVDDSVDGFLVPINCTEKFENRIAQLIDNPELRYQFTQNMILKIDKQFNNDMAEMVVSGYCDLLNG